MQYYLRYLIILAQALFFVKYVTFCQIELPPLMRRQPYSLNAQRGLGERLTKDSRNERSDHQEHGQDERHEVGGNRGRRKARRR